MRMKANGGAVRDTVRREEKEEKPAAGMASSGMPERCAARAARRMGEAPRRAPTEW